MYQGHPEVRGSHAQTFSSAARVSEPGLRLERYPEESPGAGARVPLRAAEGLGAAEVLDDAARVARERVGEGVCLRSPRVRVPLSRLAAGPSGQFGTLAGARLERMRSSMGLRPRSLICVWRTWRQRIEKLAVPIMGSIQHHDHSPTLAHAASSGRCS